jgi:hypothetical protein
MHRVIHGLLYTCKDTKCCMWEAIQKSLCTHTPYVAHVTCVTHCCVISNIFLSYWCTGTFESLFILQRRLLAALRNFMQQQSSESFENCISDSTYLMNSLPQRDTDLYFLIAQTLMMFIRS